ncbi:nucleoside monophosphate kinase [Candidatus Dependentiae bacterium]|nr:nucleoside monophosphate kinase [Candidatus Dependentiae bacterium]
MSQLHKDIVIFLGPPGSGKGSLSQLCVRRLGWMQFSTGNLCREHIANATDIGKQIDFAIKCGKLISDSLIIEMVEEWLRLQLMQPRAIILDGFPRTTVQATALHKLLKSDDFKDVNLHVVKMSVPDERIIKRLSARLICRNNKCQAVYSLHPEASLKPRQEMVCNECEDILVRRPDDEENAIKERLLIYHKHELDLINFYTSVDQPITLLNVERSLEDVYAQLINCVGVEFS